MKFLLDDIVFSTISLFDYFGNLSGFLLVNKPKQNIKWRGLLKLSGPALHTVLRAREMNAEWVEGIAIYRHSLIHASSDTSGGSKHQTVEGGKATLIIRVTAPAALIKNVAYLRETVPKEGLGVTAAALWIVGQTFDSIIELCDCLARDRGLHAAGNA